MSRKQWVYLAAVGVVGVLGALVHAGPVYTLTDLGTFGGVGGYAYGINASGQVTGHSVDGRAFVYTPGAGVQNIGTLGGSWAQAYGINASGQVVGYSQTAGGSQNAFLYTPGGGMEGIGSSWYGHSINDSGQVTGTTVTSHAFLYSDAAGLQDLGTLGGSESAGTGINASGQVTGYSRTACGAQHAFLYSSSGGMQDIGTLNGAYGSVAAGTNASGQITGGSILLYDGGPMIYYGHGFVYSGTDGMQDMGTLGGTMSAGSAINGSGDVVGISTINGGIFGGSYHAFLYSGGLMRDLNDLIAPGSGLTLENATSINDNGWIAGYGKDAAGVNHAFLLRTDGVSETIADQGGATAAPLPSALWSAAALLGLLALARYRQRTSDAAPEQDLF